MTEPSSRGSLQRARPSPIYLPPGSVPAASDPLLQPHSPGPLSSAYERSGPSGAGRLPLTPDYHVSPPTPPLPPSPAAPPRGGERISNYTLASLPSLADPHRPTERRHSTPAAVSVAMELDDAELWRSSRTEPVRRRAAEVRHWMWQGGPFEAARSVAPAPLLWGAYLIDRLQRAESMRWDLAVGAGVLISAGCLAHWQTLDTGLHAPPLGRVAPPGRGPRLAGKALGVTAPLALLVSAIATLRGQHLASRPIYTGGLLGTVFSYAITHHVSAQLLERLPAWRPTHAPDGARGPALMMVLGVAALVGATGLGARFDDWRWLLGFTVLSSTTAFLSLREWRGAIGHWPITPLRPVSQSTTELLERSDSLHSSGGDHYIAQPPARVSPLGRLNFGQAL